MLATQQPKKLSKQDEAKIAAEILRVRNDLFYFLETYVWTLDEDADIRAGEKSIKRFPSREERPELYELAALWLNPEGRDELRRLGLDKSRQMAGTWTLLECDLWDTMFHPGVRTFLQSKKEKDAINLLERVWFTFQRLPAWLKPTYQKRETELIFPKLNSLMWAIPQGGDHIRSYTASNVFCDEAQKQPEFGDAYTASIASCGNWGRLHFLGTSRGKGNAFYRYRKKPAIIEKLDGYPLLKPAINQMKITVAHLGYRLNPKYDADWVKRIQPTMSPAVWNREYEGSYEEAVGTPVLTVKPDIHFNDFQWLDGKVFWRGWDFGYRKPACIVTQFNPITDQWCWIWGTVGENEYLKNFCRRMFEMCDTMFPQYRDDNGKMQDQRWLDYCDPAGTQESDKGDGGTSIQILEDRHYARYNKYMSLRFRKFSFEYGIDLVRDRLELRNDGTPGMLIHTEFEDARDAVTGGYHYPDDRKSGESPELPQKDGYFIHLMDAARYIAVCEFEPVSGVSMDVKPGAWPQPWNELEEQGIGYAQNQDPFLAGITH